MKKIDCGQSVQIVANLGIAKLWLSHKADFDPGCVRFIESEIIGE